TLNLASNYQGSITPRKITLKLEEVLTFPYTNEDIVINVINFVAQEGMIAGDYYSGEVTVSGIYDVGTYNLADISTYKCDVVLKNYLGETIPATNYEIIGLAGNIQIYATQIWVELGDLSHTYDATAKQSAFTVKTVDAAVSLAKNQEFVTISYKNAKGEAVSPTDAGEYVVVVTLNENQRTNFTLCKEDGNPLLAGVYSYDSTLALVINARKIAVEAINKQISYRGTVVTYTLVDADITDPDAGNGGLLTAVGHKVSAKYTTSGKDVGLYGLPQTAQHKGTVALDGQFVIYDTANNDITSNYNLVSTNVVVEITNAVMSEVDTGDLENLVYNGLSRNAELVIYFQVNETHTSIAYGQTKQVEGMQVVLNGLKYGTKTVSDAIDAGDYTMYLTVGDLAGFVNKPISFTIHQRELVLLFDGQATASKQYDGTSAVNNISATNIVDGDEVTFSGKYVIGATGQTDASSTPYNLEIVVSGADAFNYKLAEGTTYTGLINQREITIEVAQGFKLTYTGLEQQIQDVNLVAKTLVTNETLSGYVDFLGIAAGEYDFNEVNVLHSNGRIEITKADGVTDSSANYKITATGKLEIAKRDVKVSVGNVDLTYNGAAQTINAFVSLAVQNPANETLADTIDAEALNALTITYSPAEVVNVGSYNATISSASTNFNFTGTTTTTFSIKQKQISINLGENVVTFNPTSNHQTALQTSHAVGIVEGHSLVGTFRTKTSGNNVGTYTVTAGDVVIENVDIQINGKSVLSNYAITSQVGSIRIVAFKLESDAVALKSDSFVYNSKDRSKDVVVYFNDANGVRREISTNTTTYGSFELVDATVAINVDKYSIKLNIPNYELPKDFVLEFNITKRKINNISFVKVNKLYDGTSSVKHNGKTEFTSQDFAGSDSFAIVGYYTINGVQTSNVGDNLDIVFEIKDANSLPQSNYEIARTGDKGSITKRTVSIKITPQAQVYNESGSYKIEYSEQAFDVVESIETYTLVEGHTLQGEVVVNKPDYDGNVDLATADYSKLFVMNSSEDVTANYNLVFEGQFVIEKAQISLDFADIDTSYVYKNQPITITPKVTVSNGEEIEIAQVYVDVRTNVEYTEALKDVGSYKTTFTVSNTHYEFKTANSFEYEITEYEFELQSSDIEVFKKAFGEPDPKLERQIETKYGEIVNVQFEREGGDNARAYDITIKSWDNKNYIIKLASGAGDDKFIITPAGTLKVVISATQENKDKLQKTYDLEEIAPIDITTLEYKTYKVTEIETLVSEVVAGTISVEGVNAGEYDISSFALTTTNYGAVVVEFETGLKYVINKRPITIQAQNGFIKVFDNTTTFDQTINIYDGANLLDAKYNLTITASYADSNVAKNIEMQLAFDGNIKENFEYQTVYGEITKRSVKVVPQSGLEVTYGTNLNGESDWGILYEIEDNTALNYEGDFKSQIIDGTLTISLKAGKTKYVAGEYEIVSTLTSNNLELNVQAGVIFTITKKQITISSESGFTKIYDGTSDVVLPADYTIEGLVEGDVVEVSGQFYKDGALSSSVGDKVIIWTLSGADADNYVASNSNGNISNKMVVVKFEYNTIANAAHNAKITDNEITEKQLVYGAEAGLLGDLPTPNHEGYTFAGWILDGQLFNNDTIIDENNWAIDVDEKTVQAQWTIKQFELKVVTLTRIDGIYKESEVGGTIDSSINKKYDYDSVVSLGGLATANYGYEFIGYADEITSSIIEGYITTGITVGLNGKDTTVYAFFKPLTPKITLDANGGQLSSSIDWQFVATGVSSLVVEYGKKLGNYSSFPIATKTGFGDYVWLDANGDEFDISAERVIDFAEDITLTASYEPLEYTITLYANGGEFTAFDTNVWTAVDKDGIPVAQGTKVEYVKKVVSYSLPIGEILTPTRAGWTFEGYDDAVLSNPETNWSELESKLITAKWSEKTYTIEIEAEHGQIIANVYDAQGIEISAIGNKNAVEIVGEKVVLTMLTTYQATIEVVQNQGYDFVNWTSDFAGIDQKTDKTVQINGLEAYSNEKALAVVANFTPAKNTIKIIVENHPTRGYAEVNGVSTETTQDGIIEVEAYTESTVEIKIVEFEGYSFAHINAVSNYNCVVEDGQDGKKVVKGFIDDVVVTITFEENLNDITIIADEDKGWFNVEDIIENSNSYTVAVRTEQPLVFDVYEKHGYLVDTNVDNWTFDTTSENKGTFALEQKDGFVRVTFTGFTFAGSITIPFVKDMFTVEVVAVKKDGSTLTVDESLTEIVELSIASENLKLNSKSTFRYEYLTVVTLAPKQNIDGYTFLTWSSQADKVRQVLALEGNVATDDNGIMTFEVNGNISTIYVVYEIDNYTVKFKTSDEAKGQLKVGNIYHSEITSTIKYGYSSMEIVAVEKEGFAFKHWINEQTSEVVGTQKSFTATNVSENVTYVAVFEGVPVEIVFKVVLDKNDVFENGEIDFAELAFTETDVTKIQSVARQDNIITYHITTLTGEDVVFDYVEKQGYEFKGLISDPRYLLTQIGSTFKFSSIFYSSNVTVNVSAKVYDISIKLTGKTDGGLIYYDSSNTKGIEEYQVTENSLKFKVKYGGDVSSIIYALTGYTIVENPYIVKQSVSIEQASDINEFAIGGINSVSENLNIEVQIVPLKFQVTFKFNYDGEEQDVVSIIEFGETTFAPALPANVTRPTRLKYNFMGWNTMANAVGKAYYFDEYGNIYSYVYDSNGIKSMEYGFFGGVGDIKKVDNPDYDYTSILYADWELVTYRVNVYFVPGSAVDTTVGNYWNNLLPQPVGRWVEYSDDLQNRVVGIKYEPGSTVIVNAPTALKGYTYAGWAFEGNIKDVNLLSGRDGEQFVATMGEEELNVYLYYTIKVNVGVIGGGSATISATEAIYEQELTISAVANEGYSFKYWLDGSTQIPNSEATMTVIATKATTYIAVFEGFIVDVRVKNTDYASAKVSSTSGETNVYRVGDTITLSVYDVRIGYVHIGWGGENAGVTHNTYTITASDLNRRDAGGSYVEFIPNTDAVNVNVQFVIDANKDWLAGAFVFDGVENFETTTRTYKYDTILNINIATKQRFELTKLTLNGVEIDVNTKSMLINTQTGFAVTGVNEIKATFRQVLWVEVKAPFTGTGTEEDPYMILTPEHLAQMFYHVNNNIEAQGTIPYAEGYYRVKTNIVLAERFWQPIGTKENPFNGTFEIIDYGITELYLDQHYEVINFGGVFGYLGPNAKIIEGQGNYQSAIIIISSVSGVVVIVLAVFIVYIYYKRRKHQKMQKGINNKSADLIDEQSVDGEKKE
ncbi:MAG: InlB B-repeat-containing protein, partial [Clostridia bacterium]|nr:InlB B-repeat-containing protein [Clostridia bacterium]